MKIPKISFAQARKATFDFIKNVPKNVKTLGQDTISIAKKSPKETAVIVGTGLMAGFILTKAAEEVKSRIFPSHYQKYINKCLKD